MSDPPDPRPAPSGTQPVPEAAPIPIERSDLTPAPEAAECAPAESENPVPDGNPVPLAAIPEPVETTPVPLTYISPEVKEEEAQREVKGLAPVPEPEIRTEETVPAIEEVQADLLQLENPAIEAASLPADLLDHDVIETREQAPKAEEPCSLIPTETELALLIREPPHSELQNVETVTSVVPIEPPQVPALRDDECSVAVRGERGLPTVVSQETAMAINPQAISKPSEILAGSQTQTPPHVEAPLAEATPVIMPPPPTTDDMSIVTEPAYEVPPEPEIPISDRELKAAVILNILGENDRALEEIDRYIREKPESLDARHVKDNILDDLGRLPECLAELTEAIRLDPKDEIALMDIESISRRVGRKEESMRILASIAPSKEVKAREAVGLLEAKRYDEIISKFSNLGPLESLVTRMVLATSLMAKARYRDAYRVLKDVLLEHPAYSEALNNMGVCMRFMGEYGYEEPMHFMHLAVEADPNYGDAWNNIGATLFVIGDYNGAMQAIRKAVTVDRRSDYLINLSKCQIMVGDIVGAKLSLTSALKYEETAEIDFALGLIAEKEGDMKWALKLYESAIDLYPNFKDAIFNKQRVRLFLKYTQK